MAIIINDNFEVTAQLDGCINEYLCKSCGHLFLYRNQDNDEGMPAFCPNCSEVAEEK